MVREVRPVAVDMGTEAFVTIDASNVFTRHGANNLRCRFTLVLPPAPPSADHQAEPVGAAAAAAAAVTAAAAHPFFEVDGVKNWDQVQFLTLTLTLTLSLTLALALPLALPLLLLLPLSPTPTPTPNPYP